MRRTPLLRDILKTGGSIVVSAQGTLSFNSSIITLPVDYPRRLPAGLDGHIVGKRLADFRSDQVCKFTYIVQAADLGCGEFDVQGL